AGMVRHPYACQAPSAQKGTPDAQRLGPERRVPDRQRESAVEPDRPAATQAHAAHREPETTGGLADAAETAAHAAELPIGPRAAAEAGTGDDRARTVERRRPAAGGVSGALRRTGRSPATAVGSGSAAQTTASPSGPASA